MDRFLDTNSGLRSRFPNIIEFPDYSVDELILIAEKMFTEQGYQLTDHSIEKMMDIFIKAKNNPQFGNGRYVRNLFEKAIRNQAVRLGQEKNLTKEDLVTITDTDIEEV
jgi:hypothetical protein